MEITSKIEKDKIGNGYWIVIEHEGNEVENTSFPISEEEIKPIKLACEKWLKEVNETKKRIPRTNKKTPK